MAANADHFKAVTKETAATHLPGLRKHARKKEYA